MIFVLLNFGVEYPVISAPRAVVHLLYGFAEDLRWRSRAVSRIMRRNAASPEVQQQANFESRRFQVVQQLRLVVAVDRPRTLEFDNYTTLHE